MRVTVCLKQKRFNTNHHQRGACAVASLMPIRKRSSVLPLPLLSDCYKASARNRVLRNPHGQKNAIQGGATGGSCRRAGDIGLQQRARTNNPGALNVSTWQRSRPGFVGQTSADAAGNITAIYQTPEQGIAAWYFLLSNRYGFGKTGQFDLASLARKYAGQDATPAEVKAYTDGWSKWSNGALQPDTIIHFALDEELLDFAKAEFAHEAGAVSPLHDDQILYGFALERQAA